MNSYNNNNGEQRNSKRNKQQHQSNTQYTSSKNRNVLETIPIHTRDSVEEVVIQPDTSIIAIAIATETATSTEPEPLPENEIKYSDFKQMDRNELRVDVITKDESMDLTMPPPQQQQQQQQQQHQSPQQPHSQIIYYPPPATATTATTATESSEAPPPIPTFPPLYSHNDTTSSNKEEEFKTYIASSKDNNVVEEDEFKVVRTKLIDPLSVIVKLAILSKMSIGTKICIHNNVVYTQELNILQPIIRYFYKSNKIDLNYLYNPIELACREYLNKPFLEKFPKMGQLFKHAQKGIHNLIETYKEFNYIKHMLIMYFHLIENHLCESLSEFNPKLFVSDNVTPLYDSILIAKCNKTWNTERIILLLNLNDFINAATDSTQIDGYDDNKNENTKVYETIQKNIKVLEEFIAQIDTETVSAFTHIPTSV